MEKQNPIGYFGKIPSYGDYILHAMPRAFTEPWERWSQDNLMHYKKYFGEGWVADYLTMSPYRFILSPGLAGEAIWCGVTFSSRDAAGRLFPLVLAMPVHPQGTTAIRLFDDIQNWIGQLESLAFQCLTPDFSKDELQERFQDKLSQLSLQWPQGIRTTSSFTHSCVNGDTYKKKFGIHLNIPENASECSLRTISADLLDETLKEFCHGYSVWWLGQSNKIMLSQGFPDEEMSLAFINHQWQQHGWMVSNSQ